MSAPHAGVQLRRDQYEAIPYGFNLVRPTLRNLFQEFILISEEICIIISQLDLEESYPTFEMDMQEMLEEMNQKQPVIEEKISYQQNVKGQISVKKVIENRIYEEDSEVSVPVYGQLCLNRVNPDIAEEGLRELTKFLVPVDGQLCLNRVNPDIAE